MKTAKLKEAADQQNKRRTQMCHAEHVESLRHMGSGRGVSLR